METLTQKIKGSSKTFPLTQMMPFCRETRGSPWVLSMAEVGSPRHTGVGPRNGTLQGFLPQVLRLHHSKREEQGGRRSPRELLEAKRSFLSFKWASETILQKPKDLGFFILQQEKVWFTFPPAVGIWAMPTKTPFLLFPFFLAVFLTLLTER